MRSEHPDDLLAAYTLDALTTEERERVQAHLAGCAECRRWVAQHESVTGLLPLSLSPGPEPSVELRDRILRAAERTEQVRVTAKVTPIRSGPSRLVRLGGWLAAAVLFLTSLGLGALDLRLAEQVRALQQPHVLQGALLATADAPGARGSVVVAPGQDGIVSVENLGPPAAGFVYEAWVIDANGPRPAGTFATTPDGRGFVALSRPPLPGQIVAITAEPSPGRATPSGKILLKATVEAGA